MKGLHSIPCLMILLAAVASPAQQRSRLGDNAALRYWSAFAQMQDSAISDEQAKELNLILEGTAPYSDLKYKDLVEKNRPALETMIRGTALPACDWGVDYAQGPDTPVDYVRRALELGRLNVLYSFHLFIAHDRDGAVRALAAGLHFSHDVAAGGTLFATLVAKKLITEHLRAIGGALHLEELSAAQKATLQNAVTELGPYGVDWDAAVKRDLTVLRSTVPTSDGSLPLDAKSSAALSKIVPAYVAMLSDPSLLAGLQETISNSPKQVADLMPNPKRVLEAKQDLTEQLAQIRSQLQ